MSNFDCLYLYYISRYAFYFLTWFVFKLVCFGNIRSDTHVQYPCSILGPFVLTEESCSVITLAFKPLSQKVSLKDQFPGVKDRYNNIWYILRKIFFFAFTLEVVIYIYYRMYVFILLKKKICCCYSYSSVRALENPGISLKVLEKSWNFDAKSPRKSEKKVLESLGIWINFFVGNHVSFTVEINEFRNF